MVGDCPSGGARSGCAGSTTWGTHEPPQSRAGGHDDRHLTHEEAAAGAPFETVCYWEEQHEAIGTALLRVWLPPELTTSIHTALAREITTHFAGMIAVLQRAIAATWDGPELAGIEAPRQLQALRERVGDALYAEIAAASGMADGPRSAAETVGLMAAIEIWLDNPVLADTAELESVDGGIESWVSRGKSDAGCPVCGCVL